MVREKAGENLSDKPQRVTSAKHDILYSKARYVLNQRHIKRPWFNLNPFLEKTVDLADLENFLPGESKYIQPLESLVLCESFHSDHPVDTRELAIDAFFKYLHSDAWSKGCSIRVLEGQLLDQLLLGLYRAEHDGTTVKHTTRAFARNNRKRTGCYKQSTAESHGSIAETLLIEFSYFGQLTKDVPNEQSLDPFEYLRHQDADVIELTDEAPSTPLVTVPLETRKQRATSLSINSQGQTVTKPNWGRRGSLMSKHMTAINSVKLLHRCITEKRQSVSGQANRSSPPDQTKSHAMSPRSSPDSKRNSISTPPATGRNRRLSSLPDPPPTPRRHSVSVSPFVYSTSRVKSNKPALDNKEMSEADEDKLSQKPSKKGFVGRIYELDFDEENNSDEEESVEDEPDLLDVKKKKSEFFGEEFYLADKIDDSRKPLSTKKKLKQNMIELKKRRKLRQEMKAKDNPTNKKPYILPPLPPLDLTDMDSHSVKHETINMPDEMPTFEEFIQLLKEDEYYDPRYRNRIRLKSRRIAQRYYIAKGKHRSSVVYNFKSIPSEIRNLPGGYNPTSRRPSVPAVRRDSSSTETRRGTESQNIRLPALQETGSRLVHNFDETFANESCVDLEHQSEEVRGVTDSETCKEHYLKNRHVYNTDHVDLPSRKSSHIRPQPKDSHYSGSNMTSSKRDIRSSGGSINSATLVFPKNTSCDLESEDHSQESEEEDDIDEPVSEVFDAKKLNLRYSIERLRKKRRSRVKKKPAFIEILAKYYNIQNALRVFRKDSPEKDPKSPQGRPNSILGKLIGKGLLNQKKESKTQVGKLKHFNFCGSKPKMSTDLGYLSRADFSQPDLPAFYLDLKEAMQYFVVRREIVVSDIQTFYSAMTSVTFTRKSCFHHKHTECQA